MNDARAHGVTGTARLLGYTIDLAPEGATVNMAVTEDHTNRQGNLHGGLIATLLDTAMGATASHLRGDDGRVPFLTLSLTVNFLAPAPRGRVSATGRITGGGHKTVFVEATARAGDGTPVAHAVGTFKRAAG
ncbi:PaaI family thioesterase [Pararhodobacter aggregans]|uniref:PaaI family thioesterase n=1 Tax=Pararhodobacter aggregans TaxID=404875 RepID=UPI003A8CAD66